MYRFGLLASVILGAALLVSLVVESSASAQESEGAKLQLTPSRDSGVSGIATLTDSEKGVTVTLNMRGLPEAGVEHINHIHGGGTCADDRAGRTAPVTIPLNPVVAQEDGTGSATTTIEDVTVSELFSQDKERFILLHAKTKKGQGVPPGIACADLAPRSEGGSFDTLPASGGSPPAVLLAVPLALISGVAGLLILRRLGLCPWANVATFTVRHDETQVETLGLLCLKECYAQVRLEASTPAPWSSAKAEERAECSLLRLPHG